MMNDKALREYGRQFGLSPVEMEVLQGLMRRYPKSEIVERYDEYKQLLEVEVKLKIRTAI